jgi:hypothetical protein
MKQAKHLRAVPAPAPIGGLLDKRFVYVPANKTDIRATFARIREQQKKGLTL